MAAELLSSAAEVQMRLPWIAVAALLMFASPARADEFRIDGFADFGISPPGGGVIETIARIDTSFLYDSTSMLVSDMSFIATGALKNDFQFLGVTDINPPNIFPPGPLTMFQWSDADAIMSTDFDFTIPAVREFQFECLSSECSRSLSGVNQVDAFFHVTATPEPSSLSLFAIGLLGFLRRKRINRNLP